MALASGFLDAGRGFLLFINDIATAVPAGEQAPRTLTESSPTTEQLMERFEGEATALAKEAVRPLAERHDLGRVTHLLIVTNTGFFAPGLDYHLIESFALDRRVARLQLGFTGSSASLEALSVARQIVRAAADAVVLMVVVELPSLHVSPRTETEAPNGAMPFGDGAAATLLSAEPSGIALIGNGQILVPATREALSMSVGEHGFRFVMSETGVDAIGRNLPDAAEGEGLAAQFRDRAVIMSCASRELAGAVARVLGIGAGRRRLESEVVSGRSNRLSATALFAFERAVAGGDRAGGYGALAVAPGIGLHWCLADMRA